MRAFQHQGQSHAGKHICPFYLKNRCIYGDRCINSHCLPENKSSQTSKSIPCKFYLQGYCHNGIKCTFSHNINGFSFRQTEKMIKMQSSRYREWGYEASEIYSSYDQLSEKELSIYRSAGNFVPGTIPLSSPSENLCTFS
ncbi:unnamed protein product [Schistosoma spindalis]|nr:unnamed protein product [Schistosoma spindale]